MIRIVACLLALVTATTAHAGAVSQANDCADVVAYFERVDEAIVDSMSELIDEPGLREHLASANRKTEEGGPGFSGLSHDEREALITYIGMPGEALASIDEDDVPGPVRDLHDSSARYWVHMVDMLTAVSEGSPSSAMPYFDRLDAAASRNYTAQQAVTDECSDEVETYAGQSDELHASADVFGEDFVTIWEDADAQEMAGIGYEFLFFATEDDLVEATPVAPTTWIRRTTA